MGDAIRVKTSQDFQKARQQLGLSQSELGRILNTDGRTVRKWETRGDAKTARDPNPIACRVMEWMLAGWRPPEFPERD